MTTDLLPRGAPVRVGLVSLGCAKNLLDSEVMAGALARDGFELTTEPESADALIVNTCGFIGPAKEEGIDTILDLARLKRSGRCRRLVVAGCLAQRYAAELTDAIPEIDAVVGLDEVESVARILGGSLAGDARRTPPLTADQSVTWLYDHTSPRIRATAAHTAYIKVAEGCDYPCSFCVIPQIRGHFRSRTPDSVLAEAEDLAADGARELILVAQDTTAYGTDLGIRHGLAGLLRQLAGVEGIEWVRFLYAYPTTLDCETLAALAEVPELCRYVDIPLQHASRRVLSAMRRPGNRASNQRLVARIREAVPGVALRSTFIVGFPGEEEEDFEELAEFVEEIRFDAMGAFLYSNEESAGSFVSEERISETEKEDRRARLMEIQRTVSLDRHRSLVGRDVRVLVDGAAEESDLLLVGRTEGQAPDVDARVLLVDSDRPLRELVGTFVTARITEAHADDLVGRVVRAAGRPGTSRQRPAPTP